MHYGLRLMTRTLILSNLSAACAIATVALAVFVPVDEQRKTAGAIGIVFGGLVAPAALLIKAAQD